MTKCEANPNLCFQHNERNILFVMIYINYLIIIGNTKGRSAWLKMELKRQFKVIDLGQFEHYFNVNFSIFKEGVFLSQRLYIEKMLQSFVMVDYNPTKVLMVEGPKFESNMSEHKMDSISYKQMVGKLIYLMNIRPNISFSISIVSQILAKSQVTPSKYHKTNLKVI